MLPTPTWLAATTGSAGRPGQINQFLGSHQVTYLYQGALKVNSSTTSGSSVTSDSSWFAQSFTAAAGQTALGYVVLYLQLTGSPSPWPLTLQADNGSGAPSGTVLASAALPKEFAPGGFAFTPVPLPWSALTPGSRYWVVAQETGDSGDNYAWAQTTAASGASTSPDGVTWTAQSYGLVIKAYDQTPVLPLAGTYEDSGARWTWYSYTTGGITGLQEYTAGQIANGYTASSRTFTYVNGLPGPGGILTGVA